MNKLPLEIKQWETKELKQAAKDYKEECDHLFNIAEKFTFFGSGTMFIYCKNCGKVINLK